MLKHATATALIVHENKILLLFHKKLKSWLPPGGHIEENELPHECVIRETKEETGLDISILSGRSNQIFDDEMAKELPLPFCMLEETIPEHNGIPEHRHIDHLFLAQPKHLNIQTDEVVQWFSAEEIKKIPASEIFENCRKLSLEILNY